MRACLVPLKTEPRNPAANWARLVQRSAEIEQYEPDLVCLPECTLTGYLYRDEDLRRFAEPVPGPTTELMGQFARKHRAFICFGVLERGASGVFNTSILLDTAGKIVLHHRKIEEKHPFLTGNRVESVNSEIGRLAMLVCGDLFNRGVVQKLDAATDLLILPMARSFDQCSPDATRWIREERQAYVDAVKAAGVTTAIVNALEVNGQEPCFGGAMVVSADGHVLAESAHGTDDIVAWEFWPRDQR